MSHDNDARVRLTHEGPLDATQLLELVVPLPDASLVTIVHDGPVTPVARKWARRLGVELEEPEPAPEPAPVMQAVPGDPPAPPPPEAPALLPAPRAIPQADEHLDIAPPLSEPALPWDASVPVAQPRPAAVDIGELLAFPWNTIESLAERAAQEDEEHVEVLDGNPRQAMLDHPTTFFPEAPNWGLPWPRQRGPDAALSRADPAIWQEPERLSAMRRDLERLGSTSLPGPKTKLEKP